MEPMPTNSQWERIWELLDRLKDASGTQREAELQDEDPLVCELVQLQLQLPPEAGEPGSFIGPYELLKPLGGGSMGVVYLARKSSTPQEVALKIIAEDLVSRDYIDYFVTEMESLSRLQHPNIVQILDSGHHDGRPYFTMTYCRGGDLDGVIKEHGTLEPTQAALYVSHIAGALQYFHDQGVADRGHLTIHGDLKPKNTLLGDCRDDRFPYGWPYLADFGVVGLLRDISPGSAPGFSVGTLHYMSPEQADGWQALGPASDVWGLGVILFECITGSLPFRGETEAETRYQINHRETPSPRAIRPDIPRVLQLICLKCLKKRPEDRYRSAAELVEDLECPLKGRPLVHAQPDAFRDRVVQWTRRAPALAARLAIIAACSAILWGYTLVKGEYAPLASDNPLGQFVTMILSRLGFSPVGQAAEAVLVWANQVTLIAWGLASWAFQRHLDRSRLEGGLQFGWRVADVVALVFLIQFDDALMSPLTVAFAVLIVASAFWSRADQIIQATLLSVAGYLVLVAIHLPTHNGADRLYRHFHYLVGLALLGLMLTYQANRTQALLRLSGSVQSVVKIGRVASRPGGATRWPGPLRVVSAMVGITALALVAASTLAAYVLSTPQRHPLSWDKTPGVLGVSFEEVRFPARGDGVGIAGWYLPSGEPRKAIVLVHGKDANRTRELDPDLGDDVPGQFPDLAVGLNKKGFAVLMIDLRGHGQSGRARFGFGRTERLDVLGAIDWLVCRGFRPGSIGVLGISMGAATAIGAASIDRRIGAVVADSSYAELASVVAQNWTPATHLPRLLLLMTKWIGRHLFGCDIDMARPVDEIGAIRRPILLIHGDADPVIPAQHARTLKEAAGDSAELWKSHSDRHAGVYFFDPQGYIDKVQEFFNCHLK